MYFSPQTLKPGYGPDSAKIVSEIKVFCFEGHSASRCSITSKYFFYKSSSGGPLYAFGGGQNWADTALNMTMTERDKPFIVMHVI